MITERTDTGLRNDGVVGKPNNETPGIDQMIVLEYADTDLLLHYFLKILIGQ
jgi:hypothetical protein